MTTGEIERPTVAHPLPGARPLAVVPVRPPGGVRRPPAPGRTPVPAPPPPPRRLRVAGLDALRALAVVAVVAYHVLPVDVPGGYVGVDVFFVLSGFLITTLLVHERRTRGRVSLRGFWGRRARRLLPALGLVVLTTTAVAAVVDLVSRGDLLVGIGRQLLGAATFTSNWEQIAGGQGYASSLTPQLFGNLWSLGVEEQFYLLWPLVVLLLLRLGARWRWTACLVTAVASAGLMAVLSLEGVDRSTLYLGTHTHLFGLMLGAALAFWHTRDGGRLVPGVPRPGQRATVGGLLAGLAGLVALGVVVATMRWEDALTYRGGLVLASVATAAVIHAVVCSPRLGASLDRGLGWVGARSYGIYLWHWPVLVVVASLLGSSVAEPSWTVVGVVLAVTAVAVTLSYRYLERPLLVDGARATWQRFVAWSRPEAGRRPVRRGVAAALTAAALALTVLAVVRAPSSSTLEDQLAAGQEAVRATQQQPVAPGATATPDAPEAPAAEPEPQPEAAAPGTTAPDTAQEPAPADTPPPPPPTPTGDQVTVIGDSVTLGSAPALSAALPGVWIDAAVSRQMKDATGFVDAIRAAGGLRPYVVVSLGTNSTVGDRVMDAVMADLGPGTTVVLVTAYGDRSWIGPTNAALAATASRYPNVVVADWAAAAGADPGVLGPDGIHPAGGAGQTLYAQVVTDALTRAAALRAGAAG